MARPLELYVLFGHLVQWSPVLLQLAPSLVAKRYPIISSSCFDRLDGTQIMNPEVARTCLSAEVRVP